MSTSVKENSGSLRHFGNILDHTVKVEIGRGRVVVSVLADFQTGIGKNGNVIAPGGIGHVNMGVSVTTQEFAHDTEATRPRQGLDTLNALILQRGRVFAVAKLQGAVDELGVARDS